MAAAFFGIGLVALVGVTIWAWQAGGSRITLLMFLAPGITLYASISVIAFFPRIWNFPVELTPENIAYRFGEAAKFDCS